MNGFIIALAWIAVATFLSAKFLTHAKNVPSPDGLNKQEQQAYEDSEQARVLKERLRDI